MSNVDLREKLCGKFCAYYKPGGSDEFACRGFTVVDSLLKKGRLITFECPEKESCAPMTLELVVRLLCGPCPFHEDDCDYAAKTAGAKPCGGFILLSGLLEKGIIVVDDLRDMQ